MNRKRLTCKRHPTYKARKRPRSDCERCWIRWLRVMNYHQGRAILELQRREKEREQ